MAAEILAQAPGLTYRQLDHWRRIALIKAAHKSHRGWFYNDEEARVVVLAARLLDAGLVLPRAVQAARALCSPGIASAQIKVTTLAPGVLLQVAPPTPRQLDGEVFSGYFAWTGSASEGGAGTSGPAEPRETI